MNLAKEISLKAFEILKNFSRKVFKPPEAKTSTSVRQRRLFFSLAVLKKKEKEINKINILTAVDIYPFETVENLYKPYVSMLVRIGKILKVGG